MFDKVLKKKRSTWQLAIWQDSEEEESTLLDLFRICFFW